MVSCWIIVSRKELGYYILVEVRELLKGFYFENEKVVMGEGYIFFFFFRLVNF